MYRILRRGRKGKWDIEDWREECTIYSPNNAELSIISMFVWNSAIKWISSVWHIPIHMQTAWRQQLRRHMGITITEKLGIFVLCRQSSVVRSFSCFHGTALFMISTATTILRVGPCMQFLFLHSQSYFPLSHWNWPQQSDFIGVLATNDIAFNKTPFSVQWQQCPLWSNYTCHSFSQNCPFLIRVNPMKPKRHVVKLITSQQI